MGTLEELTRELRGLVAGRAGVADGILPPVAFVRVFPLAGVLAAAITGFAIALGIVGWRLLRRRPLRHAVSGMFGTAVATGIAVWTGRAETYFLPGIVSGMVLTAAIGVSIAAGRPLVAWASWMARQWPIEWYWHPRVRPAYTLVTWIWLGFFSARTALQWWLFQSGEVTQLGVVRVVTGWPALVVLLAVSYLVGRKRLASLGGPSVEEFENLAPPPWRGQPNGF